MAVGGNRAYTVALQANLATSGTAAYKAAMNSAATETEKARNALAQMQLKVMQGFGSATTGRQLATQVRQFNQLGRAYEALGDSAGRAKAPLIDTGSALAAIIGLKVGEFLYQTVTQIESASIAFEKMTGSVEGSREVLSQLYALAGKGFDVNELALAEKKFLAIGYSTEQTQAWLQTIADVSGTMGADFNRVALALSQMAAKGKISAEELNQLGEAGVPALKYLADSLGLSTAEVLKLGSEGKLLAEDVLPKLKVKLDATFGGGADKRAQTLAGQVAKIKAEAQQLTFTLAESVLPAIKLLGNGIGAAVDGFESLDPTLQKSAMLLGAWALAMQFAVRKSDESTGALKGLATSVREVDGTTRSATAQLGMFAGQLGAGGRGIAGGVRGLKGSLSSASGAFGALNKGAGAVMGVLGGPWGIALAGAGLALAGFVQAQENAKDAVAALSKTIDDQTGKLTQASLTAISEAIRADISPEDVALLEKYGFSIQAAVKAVAEGGASRQKYLDDLRATREEIYKQEGGNTVLTTRINALSNSVENQGEVLDKTTGNWQQQNAAKKDAEGVSMQLTSTLQDEADAQKSATEQMKDSTTALEDQIKARYALSDAFAKGIELVDDSAKRWRSLADAQDAAAEAEDKVLGRNGVKKSATLRERKADLRDLADAYLEQAKAAAAQGKSEQDVEKILRNGRKTFVDAATVVLGSATAAERYADAAGLVPKNVSTAFRVTGLDKLQTLNEELRNLYTTAKKEGRISDSGELRITQQIDQTMKLVADTRIPVYLVDTKGNPIPVRGITTNGLSSFATSSGAPAVNLYVRDEKLADLVRVEVGGQMVDFSSVVSHRKLAV